MKKDFYQLPRIQEALESLVSAGHFSCLDLKSGLWQIKIDKLLKQYTTFSVAKLGFFECNYMFFGLCKTPATFQRLMQNCLGELNLTYCLIYLDDIIIFLQTAEEYLHHLHIVFELLKKQACMTYRHARAVEKAGMHDSSHPGVCWLHQTVPVGDCCIQRWIGVVLWQKQADQWYFPVAYGSRALMPHEKNYHSTKLQFLALKWAVTEYFKSIWPIMEYLHHLHIVFDQFREHNQNWSHPSATFLGMKSHTWLIKSQRVGSAPATQT